MDLGSGGGIVWYDGTVGLNYDAAATEERFLDLHERGRRYLSFPSFSGGFI